MDTLETKKISKFLSLVLRHRPETIGIELDAQGWTDVETLIAKLKRRFNGFNMEVLEQVVAENNKQRFSFNPKKTKIRASQGHSVAVALDYKPVLPPEILYHGTVGKFLGLIAKSGLKKMSRHHVHLSKDLGTAENVGSRRGEAIILQVKAGEMHRDGFEFYQSDNGVWLTDNVPPKYILFP
jgi:putative RNA 2'-phosphotransferase